MKHITIEKVVLFLAASFAAYNFGLVGGYIEGTKFSVGGVIAGIVVNISLAIASSKFGSLNGKTRTRQATVAFVSMLVLAPAIVAPVIYYSLPVTFLDVWWLRALYALAYPLVADMAIVAMGAVSGKTLIALSDPTAAQSGAGAPSADAVRKNKKRTRTDSDSATQSVARPTESGGLSPRYPRMCEYCASDSPFAVLKSPNAVGGHMKKHHPELCKTKKARTLAENLFSKVDA
jgi:hypothetical protein